MSGAYFDAHCHLQDARLDVVRGEVLARAEAAGVDRMVCCGTRPADWDAVLALVAAHASVLPMLGLHPWYVAEARADWLAELESALQGSRAGVGECGLDFAIRELDRARQEQAFRAQLRLARAFDRPVAMHCVRAWGALVTILGEEGLPSMGGMVHAFSGSAETARELQALGCYLSFSGARSPKALLAVGAQRLLIESDAPDGGPDCQEPGSLPRRVEDLARLRGESPADLARQTRANAMMLFCGGVP